MSIIRNTIENNIVDDNTPVKITVRIGDEQYLSSLVLNTPDGRYYNGDLNDFEIGLGKDLRNKQSYLTVKVTDANPRTNWTSITVDLTNDNIHETYEGLSDIDNGTVIYITTINHI